MSVNGSPNSAQPVETIYVDNHRVACDGGGGSLGHPKVWYEMGDEGKRDAPPETFFGPV
eukprot:gene2285-2866_t